MLKDFYSYVSERQSITNNKTQGFPKPWTQDKILQEWKFCSVLRDDDASSEWFVMNLKLKNMDNLAQSLWVAILFRWFNIPATGETLLANDLVKNWDPNRAESVISKQGKFISAAYRTKAPALGKLKGTIKVVDDFHKNLGLHTSQLKKCRSWDQAYDYLLSIPYFGPFNTYQFLLDLMRTSWEDIFGDPSQWCVAGPGAVRGLNWIHNRDVDTKLPTDQSYKEIVALHITRPITLQHLWVSDIQHNLCEWDKYNRVLNGGRLKCKYKGL